MYELEVTGGNVKSRGHTGSGHFRNCLLVPDFLISFHILHKIVEIFR